MILNLTTNIKFSNFYKKFNLLSLFFIIFSFSIISYQGLNVGVDFIGGTLIEVRTQETEIM